MAPAGSSCGVSEAIIHGISIPMFGRDIFLSFPSSGKGDNWGFKRDHGRAQTQTKIVSERNNIILGSFTSSYPRNNIPLRMCREWNLFGGLIGLLKCSYLYGLSQHLHVAWTRMLRIMSKSSSLFFSICLHRYFLDFDLRHNHIYKL